MEASAIFGRWRPTADDPVAVTEDIAVDGSPAWAPDGKHLYFSSDRGGSLNLWRVPIEESTGDVLGEPEPLTTPSTYALHLSFAADGTRAVCASEERSSRLQRAGFDIALGTVSAPESILEASAVLIYSEPSPDGEWVASGTGPPQEDIFIIRTDGTRRRQLTDDLHRDRLPRWSPDGETLSFYSDRSGSYELWRVRRDGSDLTQLTDTPGVSVLYHAHSPDGARMSYVSSDGDAFIFDPNVPWTEQTPERLPPWESEPNANVYAWTPDGTMLAGWITPGGPGIFVYSLAEKTYTKLTDEGSRPSWLPDGRGIVYHDGGDIFLLDIETRDTRNLDLPGFNLGPTLSADGAWLYYTSYDFGSDIWLVELD